MLVLFPAQADEIAASVYRALAEEVTTVSQRMETAIHLIRDQVALVLEKKQAGEEEVARQRPRRCRTIARRFEERRRSICPWVTKPLLNDTD